MKYEGSLVTPNSSYDVVIVEGKTQRRLDILKVDPNLLPSSRDRIELTLVEDLRNGDKEYNGNLSLYYLHERIMREARLYRFKPEEVEESNDFEEGKFLYICKQKSERFEYNYKSENYNKIYRYLRTPEATLELSLTDEVYSETGKHQFLNYSKLEVKGTTFDKNSVMLSRIATINELREKYDLTWADNKDYVWVDSIKMLKAFIEEIKQYALADPKNALLILDTETTGLDIYHIPEVEGGRDKLVSIILSWKDDHAIYIPIRHTYEDNLDEDEVIRLLEPLLEYIPIGTQYGLFDFKVFLKYRNRNNKPLKLKLRQDLLLINYIIQPNPHESIRGLKENVWAYLGIKQLSLKDLFPPTKDGGKTEIQFQLLNKEIALLYACPDTDLLRKLIKQRHPLVYKQSIPIYNTEVKFFPIAAQAEYYGLKVELNKFYKEKILCEQISKELEELVYTLAGYKFNLNSPDQVANLLYNKMGCQILIASKTNPSKGSTSSKALKNLAKVKADEPSNLFTGDIIQEVEGEKKPRIILEAKDLNDKKYPIISVLLAYREYNKLITGFFESIHKSNKGGRLYSWVNPTGAQTGRIISPLQTLPPFIKNMIVADTSEHGLVIMDYKQVELRLMFGLAKELKMIQESSDPSKDIHRIIAAGVYHKAIWEISKKLRGLAKGLNFGIPYALGILNLAITLYGFAKDAIQQKKFMDQASEDKRNYFKAMPRVERLFINAKNFVLENGFMMTKFGRVFMYPNIFTETDKGKIARMLRQAANGMIQGLGADIFKVGSVDLEERYKKRGWDSMVNVVNPETGEEEGEYPLVRQAFFVHDELGNVYHKKTINPLQVLYELRKSMQIDIPGFPPLFIGACVVKCWGDAKEDKYEIPTELLERWCNEVEQGMHTEPLENPEEWVYNEIVKFREKEFEEYFVVLTEQLKKEGKEVTPDNIASIFRHDVLSHDVMAMYKEKDFEAKYGRSGEHVELLEFAVKEYIRDFNILEETYNEYSTEFESVDDYLRSFISSDENIIDLQKERERIEAKRRKDEIFSSIESKEDENSELMEAMYDIEEYSGPIDVNDNFGFDTSEDDLYGEEYHKFLGEYYDEEEYRQREKEIDSSFTSFVITIGRTKYIDLTVSSNKTTKAVIEYLKGIHLDDGLYDVQIRKGSQVIETGLKVDKLDETMIDLMLKKDDNYFTSIMS